MLLNKLQLFRLDDPLRQIRIITRCPEQYKGLQLDDVSVEENVGDLEIYRGCCVVFDDMLESNQRMIDPFSTRGRHKLRDVYYLSQSYFKPKHTQTHPNTPYPITPYRTQTHHTVPKHTIRNIGNIINLFRQTLRDLQPIYADIAGLDMSYNEFKTVCREAWKEKYN